MIKQFIEKLIETTFLYKIINYYKYNIIIRKDYLYINNIFIILPIIDDNIIYLILLLINLIKLKGQI